MKIISGLICLRQPSAIILGLILTATLFSTGCGKSKPPAAQTTATTADQNTNQTAANQNTPLATVDHMSVSEQHSMATAAATPGTMTTQTNGQPDLKDLDRGLLRWISGNRRLPTSFEDFASSTDVTIPPPPPGKKYIIAKNMHIQLVNR